MEGFFLLEWNDLAGTDGHLNGVSWEMLDDDLPSITLFKLFTEPAKSRFDGVIRSASFPEKLLGGTIFAFISERVNVGTGCIVPICTMFLFSIFLSGGFLNDRISLDPCLKNHSPLNFFT